MTPEVASALVGGARLASRALRDAAEGDISPRDKAALRVLERYFNARILLPARAYLLCLGLPSEAAGDTIPDGSLQAEISRVATAAGTEATSTMMRARMAAWAAAASSNGGD